MKHKNMDCKNLLQIVHNLFNSWFLEMKQIYSGPEVLFQDLHRDEIRG